MVGSAALAGWAPLGCSVVAVFLFAGPHNWLEARYFLGRMPARWGKLRPYFILGFGGVLGLTVAAAALPWLGRSFGWNYNVWLAALGAWNSLFVAWVVALAALRSRQNPRRDWLPLLPLAGLALSAAWLAPVGLGLALVYLHPLMGFWLLDRELTRSRPTWRGPYRTTLCLVPPLLAAVAWHLAGAPPLPGEGSDPLTLQISRHAGAGVVPWATGRVLVGSHTFLELLHYGVWVVAVPLIGLKTAPWSLDGVPLARRSPRWRRGLALGLAAGLGAVLVLWGGFLADYPLTRSVYFTVATLHVLAEVPFLLRAL